MEKPLFAYGTLKHPATQREQMGHGCPVIAASLPGYRLHQGKWPYLVKSDNESVTGLLLQELNDDDYIKLDNYEELQIGYYTRESMVAKTEDGRSIDCFVYIPNLDEWPKDWL